MTETVPEDSVLRRHYEAMRANNPATPRADDKEICNDQASSCGIMGWLKRLFT